MSGSASLRNFERRIMRWVYPDDDVVAVPEPEELMRLVYPDDVVVVPEPEEDRSAEIEQAFADLEQTFDRAHFDRSHPARATLRSLEFHVRDLQASLATTEAELARRAGEVEQLRNNVRQMRDRVREALGVHHD